MANVDSQQAILAKLGITAGGMVEVAAGAAGNAGARQGRGFGSLEANIVAERDAHGGTKPGAWKIIGRLPRKIDAAGNFVLQSTSAGNQAFDRFVLVCTCHKDGSDAQAVFTVGAGKATSEAGKWFGVNSVAAKYAYVKGEPTIS